MTSFIRFRWPHRGEQECVDGFEAAASGTADWMVLPAAYQETPFFQLRRLGLDCSQRRRRSPLRCSLGANAATAQTRTILN
jgi:hypothetical protein